MSRYTVLLDRLSIFKYLKSALSFRPVGLKITLVAMLIDATLEYRIAGKFRGTRFLWFSNSFQFVGLIFVVAATPRKI